MRRALLAIALGVLLALPLGNLLPGASAQDDGGTPAADAKLLTSAKPVEGRCGKDAPRVLFRATIPEDATQAEFVLTCADDLDLFVNFGEKLPEPSGTETPNYARLASSRALGFTRGGNERIILTKYTTPPITAGVVYVLVSGSDARLASAVFTLRASWYSAAPPPTALPRGTTLLTLEKPREVTVPAAGKNATHFAVDVPVNATRLTVTTSGATHDTDSFVRYNQPIDDDARNHDYRQVSDEKDETLSIGVRATPPLRPGRYFITVLSYGQGADVKFTLTASIGTDVPTGPPPQDGPPVDGALPLDGTDFAIALPVESRSYSTYTLTIPSNAKSLLLTAKAGAADIDLYLRYQRAMGNWDLDPDYRADGPESREVIWVGADGTPPLRAGIWYLDINGPDLTADSQGEIAVTLSAQLDVPRPAGASRSRRPTPNPLTLGQTVDATIVRAEAPYQLYRFTVPEGAKALYVETTGATADLDLYLAFGDVPDQWNAADYVRETGRLNESLRITNEDRPPLRPGAYTLAVLSQVDGDVTVEFKLLATLDRPPRRPHLKYPPYASRTGLTPLKRAINATVQLSTNEANGSGTVVTPSGLILTNRHVIERPSNEPSYYEREIFVSFTDGVDEPPRQVYEAETIFQDVELDLALLKITRTLFGAPATRLNLIHLALGDSAALTLGQRLRVLGFPDVGGEGSRTSVSLTQGIVAGFQRQKGKRAWVKTDASVASGNSGGATIDDEGRLVAIPTMVITRQEDKLSYLRPIERVPKPWRARIARELRR